MKTTLRVRPRTTSAPQPELGDKLKIESLPTNVLIGPDGKVNQVQEGVERYLEYQVRGLLQAKKK